MQIMNLEIGVERALRAYLNERGATDVDAKIASHLSEAITRIKNNLEGMRASDDFSKRLIDAYAQLKAWSQTL